MAVYTFSTIPQLKAALISAGILVTTYYETSPYLIFTTTLTNKVIKVRLDSGFFVGTSWSSGNTTVGEATIATKGTGSTISTGYLIVGSDFFAMTINFQVSNQTTLLAIFCTGNDGTTKFALGYSSDSIFTSYTLAQYIVTPSTNTALKPICVHTNVSSQGIQVNDSYLWYLSEHHLKFASSNRISTVRPNNVKLALKKMEYYNPSLNLFDRPVEVYGDDVAIRMVQYDNVKNLGCLMLLGGAV